MAFSLYSATVMNWLQALAAVGGFMERGLAHAQAQGVSPEDYVQARIAPDMLPLRFQIISVVHHSLGAIEGVRAGVFAPRMDDPGLDYAGLQVLVADARQRLEAVSPEQVNALEGTSVVFKLGERQMPFHAEDFLMSFSVPNFYFHATTAYDLLRMKGVPLGKRDFLGRMRLKA